MRDLPLAWWPICRITEPGDDGRARDVNHGPFGQIKLEPDVSWRYGLGRPSGLASGGAEGSEADGEGHGAELGQDGLAVGGADVGQDVAEVVSGAQELGLDVDVVVG